MDIHLKILNNPYQKKDVFGRKYVDWLDFFIDKIYRKFISMKGFFEFITLILVNPIDNLRIFTSLNKKSLLCLMIQLM